MSAVRDIPAEAFEMDAATRTGDEAHLDLKWFLKQTPDWLDPCFGGDRDYELLFEMVKKNPQLAKKCFAGHGGRKALPLGYLLAAKAPLEMIQQLHEMSPSALKIRDTRYRQLPLHDAILYQCSSDVVGFVLKGFPEAAGLATLDRKLPIDMLMELLHSSNLDEHKFMRVFQMLHEAYDPLEEGHWDDCWGQRCNQSPTLLSHRNAPPDLLRWLAKKQDEQSRPCPVHFYREIETQTVIKNLRHVVPMLKRTELHFRGNNTSMDGSFLARLFSETKMTPTLALDVYHFDITLPSDWGCQTKQW